SVAPLTVPPGRLAFTSCRFPPFPTEPGRPGSRPGRPAARRSGVRSAARVLRADGKRRLGWAQVVATGGRVTVLIRTTPASNPHTRSLRPGGAPRLPAEFGRPHRDLLAGGLRHADRP